MAVMYRAGRWGGVVILDSTKVYVDSGAYQALTVASGGVKCALLGMVAAFLVTFGNGGGVGTTVAGLSRVPFIVGVDRYLPAAFSKIHPKWRTPYVAILVQAIISTIVLLLCQIKESPQSAYQFLVDAATILYFVPFLYMYAGVIKLAARKDRAENEHAVLIPGGRLGELITGGSVLLVPVAGLF